jgi:hypothetical protein
MYKKKPPEATWCALLLLTAVICLIQHSLIVFVDCAGETRELPALLPPHAGPRVFSCPAQLSPSGRSYALCCLGMPVCSRQSRFRRQACWMCPAWGFHDEAQAMAGGNMLYLLPSFIDGGRYG